MAPERDRLTIAEDGQFPNVTPPTNDSNHSPTDHCDDRHSHQDHQHRASDTRSIDRAHLLHCKVAIRIQYLVVQEVLRTELLVPHAIGGLSVHQEAPTNHSLTNAWNTACTPSTTNHRLWSPHLGQLHRATRHRVVAYLDL